MEKFFAFIGSADCYLDILTDTGETTGLTLRGNCNQCSVKPNAETKELPGNGLDNFGQTIASVVIPKPMTATIKFNQIERSLFAAAFFGTDAPLAQAAKTGATATVTARADRFVEIGGGYNLTVNSVETAGGEALTAGTDYEVNARLGMIKLLGTSTLAADGDTLTVTYDAPALSGGNAMKAMTKSNVRIRIRLDGRNYADGRRFVCDIYQMKLNPSSEFNFIGEDFVEVQFDGSLETPANRDTPMQVVWLE